MTTGEFLLCCAWAVFHVLQVALGVAALRQGAGATGGRRLGSLITSGAASVVPLATLVVVAYDLAVGINVSGFDWWIIQGELLFVNALAFLVILVAAGLPPYPPQHWKSTASRVSLALAAACALTYLGIKTSGPAPRLF